MIGQNAREHLKKFAEKVTGIGNPKPSQISVRSRKPRTYKLRDDGETPNNPRYPLTVYRSPVRLDPQFDPAAIFEVLFASNRWKDSWRYKMYGYNHFHTRTHECLGVARGTLVALFGGTKGRRIELKAGDVVIIPAGVGHKHIRQSKDLLIVGCYPSNAGKYDEPKPDDISHEWALTNIKKVKRPLTDPLYGKHGGLLTQWRK